MDIRYLDQKMIDEFQKKVKYKADEAEISFAFNEIYKRGLQDDPRVKESLRDYQEYLLENEYDFIVDVAKDAKAAQEELKPSYNRTLAIALYQYLDLGGFPDEKIEEIAKNFKFDLKDIATKIVKHKREEIDHADIFDVICGELGLSNIAEKAMEEVKRTIPLYDDWSNRKQFSTTLYVKSNSRNKDSDIYGVECSFDDNGNCQNLIIRLEGEDNPITINVSAVPNLAVSKSEIKGKSIDDEER